MCGSWVRISPTESTYDSILVHPVVLRSMRVREAFLEAFILPHLLTLKLPLPEHTSLLL